MADREILLARLGAESGVGAPPPARFPSARGGPRTQHSLYWQAFRPLLRAIHQKPLKSAAGRKACDALLIFRIVVLQQLCKLSDDQAEYQIRDRYSLSRFLDLTPADVVPAGLARRQAPAEGRRSPTGRRSMAPTATAPRTT